MEGTRSSGGFLSRGWWAPDARGWVSALRLPTALCPCLPQSLAALSASFFFQPFLSTSVSLCLCVCLCLSVPYHSGCVCLSLPLQLYQALSVCICFCVSLCLSLLPSTSLYPLCLSLQMPVSVFISFSPLPSPILFLFSSLLSLGGCSSPTRQPGDTSGHCLGSTSRSPPYARHLGVDSVFPLQLWGREGAPGREDTVPSICSGAPEPLTPSAAIKGARSRGSER